MSMTLRFTTPHNTAILMDELMALPGMAPTSGDDRFPFMVSSDGKTVEITLDDYVPVGALEIEAVIVAHNPNRTRAPSLDEQRRQADLTTVRARSRTDPEMAALLRLLGLDEPTELRRQTGPSLRQSAEPRNRVAVLRTRLEGQSRTARLTASDGYRCDSCVGATDGTPAGLALTEVLPEPFPPLAVWEGCIVIDADPERLADYGEAMRAVPEYHRGRLVGLRLGANPGNYEAATGILTLPRRTAATTRPPALALHHLFGHVLSEAADAELLHSFAVRFWVGDIPLDHPDPLHAAGDDLPGAIRRDFAESYVETLNGIKSERVVWMHRHVFRD